MWVCNEQAVGQDAFGADTGAADGRGNSEDAFHRKLKGIVNADYTELALAAGPLDIAGQVGPPHTPGSPFHLQHPSHVSSNHVSFLHNFIHLGLLLSRDA